MHDIKRRIASAIAHTKNIVLPGHSKNRWRELLELRTSNKSGSWYPATTPEQLEADIFGTKWEEYQHLNVPPSCSAFRAPLFGRKGTVEVDHLPVGTHVYLHNVKGKGRWVAMCKGVDRQEVDFTVLILFRGRDQSQEGVFDFAPGEPSPLSTVTSEELPEYWRNKAARPSPRYAERINLTLEDLKSLGLFKFVRIE